VLGVACGAASIEAADFDLCVRGSALEAVHTARLHLTVEGTDVAAFAPRLGALLANERFWNNEADEVFGEPFDADLCGAAVAPELYLTITLTADVAHDLLAGQTRSVANPLAVTATRDLRLAPAAPPNQVAPPEEAPEPGDVVVDKDGKLRYRVMRIYYATDRKPVGKYATPPQNVYSGQEGDLSFGVLNVSLPKSHQIGHLEAPSLLLLEFRADPDKHVVLQSLQLLSTDAWRAQIAKRATHLGSPGVLVFIHGYNSSFEDAALRAAQLAFDLKFGGATVLFSWPSRDQLRNYVADEQTAEWAAHDMKIVLASIATIAPNTPVYVVAHSMGNRVFARGFQALIAEKPDLQRAFKEVVMAAPDVDADVFRRDIAPAILNKGTRFTLYASSKDEALMISSSLHGGYRRLGESGDGIVVMSGLDTVDASAVRTDLLGHSYYGESQTVISDMKYVIRQSLPPEQREAKSVLERVQNTALGLYWRIRVLAAAAGP
jgi:esterase/lipase superfamily enzyme